MTGRSRPHRSKISPTLTDVQQKMVDTLRSDPQTSEEEHFKLVLVMTEMERVKFLVRSYVRTRLWKVSPTAACPRHVSAPAASHPQDKNESRAEQLADRKVLAVDSRNARDTSLAVWSRNGTC